MRCGGGVAFTKTKPAGLTVFFKNQQVLKKSQFRIEVCTSFRDGYFLLPAHYLDTGTLSGCRDCRGLVVAVQ